MFRVWVTISLSCLFLFINTLSGQNYLSGPESVAYDSLNNRYLVSSFSSASIVAIDSEGNQSYFKTGLSPMVLGNCIFENTFYVTTGTRVKGFDLTSTDEVFDLFVQGSSQMDGMTTDPEGNLYVVDGVAKTVFKINLSTGSYEPFVTGGLPSLAQDAIYDAINDRILICSYEDSSPIKAFYPGSGIVYSVVYTEVGGFDGITMDQFGNVYAGSWNSGEIYRYEQTFSEPPAVISTGHNGPTGLDFNRRTNELAVPNFNSNSLNIIPIEYPDIVANFKAEHNTGNAPATILFSDLSYAASSLTAWEWDFTGDGIPDSYEQNPLWIFETPGVYTVSLEVITGEGSETVTRENMITIYSGETSLNYHYKDNYVSCPPSPEMNFSGAFTFEACIKPLGFGPINIFGESRIFNKEVIDVYLNQDNIADWKANSMIVVLRTTGGTLSKLTTPENSINSGIWQHIAVVYDSALSELNIYINGELQELSTLYTGTPGGNLEDNSDIPLIIGNNGEKTRGFDGMIDEVRIWNTARNSEQINGDFTHSLNGDEQGLAAYWKLNEGNGHICYDFSPNQNHGQIIDACWVEGIDLSTLVGLEHDSEPVNSVANLFTLSQNYPNPFNPTTTISYSLLQAGPVDLTVYNIAGQKVKTLVRNLHQLPGTFHVTWDGTDQWGNVVSSGIYFYKLKGNHYSQTRKMVFLK